MFNKIICTLFYQVYFINSFNCNRTKETLVMAEVVAVVEDHKNTVTLTKVICLS